MQELIEWLDNLIMIVKELEGINFKTFYYDMGKRL